MCLNGERGAYIFYTQVFTDELFVENNVCRLIRCRTLKSHHTYFEWKIREIFHKRVSIFYRMPTHPDLAHHDSNSRVLPQGHKNGLPDCGWVEPTDEGSKAPLNHPLPTTTLVACEDNGAEASGYDKPSSSRPVSQFWKKILNKQKGHSCRVDSKHQVSDRIGLQTESHQT